MEAQTVTTQVEQPETIDMENLPELPVSAKELEEILVGLGAEVAHPTRMDPVATVNGKFLGFWTE